MVNTFPETNISPEKWEMKPYKQWEKLPTSTGAGFQPSTVAPKNGCLEYDPASFWGVSAYFQGRTCCEISRECTSIIQQIPGGYCTSPSW